MLSNAFSKVIDGYTVSAFHVESDISYLFIFDDNGYDSIMRVREQNGVASAAIEDSVLFEPLSETQEIISKLLAA